MSPKCPPARVKGSKWSSSDVIETYFPTAFLAIVMFFPVFFRFSATRFFTSEFFVMMNFLLLKINEFFRAQSLRLEFLQYLHVHLPSRS